MYFFPVVSRVSENAIGHNWDEVQKPSRHLDPSYPLAFVVHINCSDVNDDNCEGDDHVYDDDSQE